MDARAKELAQRMNHSHEQLLALKERLSRDKSTIRYKVVSSGISSNSNAAFIIADAILQEPHAVHLVARSTGNSLEMEKDWELMSELDKDELLPRKCRLINFIGCVNFFGTGFLN